MLKWRLAATIVQVITHTTVDLMRRKVREDGVQRPDKVPEQIIFKLTWVLYIRYVL